MYINGIHVHITHSIYCQAIKEILSYTAFYNLCFNKQVLNYVYFWVFFFNIVNYLAQ